MSGKSFLEYDAYEEALTEGDYKEYKDTLPQ